MAEGSSSDSPISSLGGKLVTPLGPVPRPLDDSEDTSLLSGIVLDTSDSDAEDRSTESCKTEGEKGVGLHLSSETSGLQSASPNKSSINPAFLEFTSVNEFGLVELDIDKIERAFWKLNLDETIKDEHLEDRNVQYLRDRITNFLKISEESEISSQHNEEEFNKWGEDVAEQESENISAEKLITFKYEKEGPLSRPELSNNSEDTSLLSGIVLDTSDSEEEDDTTESCKTEGYKDPLPRPELSNNSEDTSLLSGIVLDTSDSEEEDNTNESCKTEDDINKPWNQKPHLRQTCKEFFQKKFGNTKFTEKDLDNFIRCFLNDAHSDLLPAVNILSRIAYPKLNERHLLPDFPCGVFAEEKDYDAKDISISVEHFEFSHKELVMNFLDLFQSEEFDSVAIDWEKNPKINYFLPSFNKFLKDKQSFKFPVKCFVIILAILKNPYCKFEFFYDDKPSAVKEETAIAEYLVTCLKYPVILADKDVSEKLTETIISFANVHKSFLAQTVTGFNALLSVPKEKLLSEKHAYEIYCRVLDIMISIGATIIYLCLPEHFNSISNLAANDQNCELYFCLLNACEILIADAIENESQVEAESSEGKNLKSFYSDCYHYFGNVLTNRLIPIFRKYEMQKSREERYLIKKHAIYPNKFGYLNTEMELLFDECRLEPKPSNLAKVKECTFNSDGKCLCFSNAQFGYINTGDRSELSSDSRFPQSYLEGVNKILT